MSRRERYGLAAICLMIVSLGSTLLVEVDDVRDYHPPTLLERVEPDGTKTLHKIDGAYPSLPDPLPENPLQHLHPQDRPS